MPRLRKHSARPKGQRKAANNLPKMWREVYKEDVTNTGNVCPSGIRKTIYHLRVPFFPDVVAAESQYLIVPFDARHDLLGITAAKLVESQI